MPSRPLTAEQKDDAVRLRRLFDGWRSTQIDGSGKRRSIEDIAADVGYKQSAFSQMLNGTMALNERAAAVFSGLLKQPVSAFSPTLASKIEAIAQGAPLAIRETPATYHKPKARRGDPKWAITFTSQAQLDLLDTVRLYGPLLADEQCAAITQIIRGSVRLPLKEPV